MLSDQILKLFESARIDPKKFDHFDYVEAFEKLKQDYNSTVERNPTKRKIVQQFIEKAYEQISKKDPVMRKQKVQSFIKRMEMNKRIQDQKLQAMRFISSNYDQKSKQLLFYPNVNKKRSKYQVLKYRNEIQMPLSASRNYWNDQQNEEMEVIDQGEPVEEEKPIMEPNLTDEFVQDQY